MCRRDNKYNMHAKHLDGLISCLESRREILQETVTVYTSVCTTHGIKEI